MYELSHKLSNNLIRLYDEIREVLENLTQKQILAVALGNCVKSALKYSI